MKHLKLLGLSVMAASLLMALPGAGTASATVICKNNLNTEHCSEPYLAGAEGTASLEGTATFQAGSFSTECSESVVKSTLKEAGSSTTAVKSGISTITWGGCSSTTDTLNGGSAELQWIPGTDNGTLTTFDTEVTVLHTGVDCIYGASSGGTVVGTTVGGNPGSLVVETSFPKKGGGGLCPSTGIFRAKYVATSPTNAWVSAG